VTPQIDFNARWYGDEMNYTFIIDTSLTVDDLLKKNVELYNEWLQYHKG
jgi:hypothetical protein